MNYGLRIMDYGSCVMGYELSANVFIPRRHLMRFSEKL